MKRRDECMRGEVAGIGEDGAGVGDGDEIKDDGGADEQKRVKKEFALRNRQQCNIQ